MYEGSDLELNLLLLNIKVAITVYMYGKVQQVRKTNID